MLEISLFMFLIKCSWSLTSRRMDEFLQLSAVTRATTFDFSLPLCGPACKRWSPGSNLFCSNQEHAVDNICGLQEKGWCWFYFFSFSFYFFHFVNVDFDVLGHLYPPRERKGIPPCTSGGRNKHCNKFFTSLCYTSHLRLTFWFHFGFLFGFIFYYYVL